MADDLLKMRHHKLLFELKFLYADLEYHENIMNNASSEFQSEFIHFCKEEGTYEILFPESPPPKPGKPEIEKPDNEKIYEPEKKNISKESKNLHRKIATMTHPDKLLSLSEADRNHRNEIFLKANEFAEKDDLFALQQVALELGIDLGEPTGEQLDLFEEEAKRIKQKIQKITGTFAWVWYHSEDDGIKNNLLFKYGEILMGQPIEKKSKPKPTMKKKVENPYLEALRKIQRKK